MDISIACTAVLGLLLFGLGLYVSLLRRSLGVIVGHDASPVSKMHRAVRAHANTAEYVPFLAILFLWHGSHQPSLWINATIVAATLARILLIVGLLWLSPLDKPNAARFLGALLTYACGLALAVAMLVRWLNM
jgi:uncharacterized membrane protein YecN with MAPEG domain